MEASEKKRLTEQIKIKAQELGFFSCGISEASCLEEDGSRLNKWLMKGFHSGMTYMANHFEKRTDPRNLLLNAKSVISVLYNYAPKQFLPDEDNYKISCYAYGKDYHLILKKKLKQLADFIQMEHRGSNCRLFVDSAPVLEKAWAAKSGLGWIGKNTCLITQNHGSYFFIGDIITDTDLEYNKPVARNNCGGCMRCVNGCPTGALQPYELNAQKCISYLTIENKENFIPEEFKGTFQNWIFGCDICQQVCPWNKFAVPHNEPDFDPGTDLFNLKKQDWENLSQTTFQELYRNSPLKRAKFSGIKRNIFFIK